MPNAREYKYEGDLLYLKCCGCGEWKTADCYTKQRGGLFGIRGKCRECMKKYRIANRERDSSYGKKYRMLNKEKIAERSREYYINNRDAVIERCKKYRDNNSEKRNAHNREYRKINKHRVREGHKRYYKENREKIMEYELEYKAKRNNELGFNLSTFHTRAEKYAKNHSLIPATCPLCGDNENIEMHHPSYEKYEYWCKVVFCCSSCHKLIHGGVIECPQPIDLLTEVLDPNQI